MAGEAIYALGSWATLQAAASTADGVVCGGAVTPVSTALSTGSEANYPTLDLKLEVTSGTPTAGGTVDVYLRGKADTDEEPALDATDLGHSHHLCTIVMHDTASSSYYSYGVPNFDPEGSLYMVNNDGSSTLTIALKGRGRSMKEAT